MKNEVLAKLDRRNRILVQIKEMLIEELELDYKVEEIDPDTSLFATGLGLDSVDAVVILVELESEFDIKISEKESRKVLRSINSIADAVIQKLNEQDEQN